MTNQISGKRFLFPSHTQTQLDLMFECQLHLTHAHFHHKPRSLSETNTRLTMRVHLAPNQRKKWTQLEKPPPIWKTSARSSSVDSNGKCRCHWWDLKKVPLHTHAHKHPCKQTLCRRTKQRTESLSLPRLICQHPACKTCALGFNCVHCVEWLYEWVGEWVTKSLCLSSRIGLFNWHWWELDSEIRFFFKWCSKTFQVHSLKMFCQRVPVWINIKSSIFCRAISLYRILFSRNHQKTSFDNFVDQLSLWLCSDDFRLTKG